MIQTHQSFKSGRHNIFTEEINKIASRSNDEKTIQSIDLIERYAYETSKDLVSEEEIYKCDNIIKEYKKDVVKENVKEHNLNWPQTIDHPTEH